MTDLSAEQVCSSFLKNGYSVFEVENRSNLDRLRDFVVERACEYLSIREKPSNAEQFLDTIHERIQPTALNAFKLKIMNALIAQPWFMETYFSLGRKQLGQLVGTDLAMQKNIGMNIHMPGDDSSLVPLHSDVWGSECSAFEVVLWVPLVHVFGTKSVFYLDPEKDRVWRKKIRSYENLDALYQALKPDLQWLDLKYGQGLIFTSTMMHGNHINRENTTRWSFNVRFKGLFTPYSNKKFGEFFVPMQVSPASEVGLRFAFPEGSDD